MRRWTTGLAALLAIALLAAPIATQETAQTLGVDEQRLIGAPLGAPLGGNELDRATHELASKLRCPICQGLSVADSSTSSAIAMMAQIRDLLSQGYTPKQVTDYFASSYGEFVLLQPKADGFNLLVWLAPILALGLGVAIVARRLMAPASTTADGDGDSELAEYLERVRSEVGSQQAGGTNG